MVLAATDRLVTPEAVELEFDTAGVGSRVLAITIDLLIMAALSFASIMATGFIAAFGQFFAGVAIGLLVLAQFLIFLGYPALLETLWRGRTIGKAALGLRVVTVEGSPIRFRHAAIRAVSGLVDFLLSSGAVAILFVLLTRRNQRLGDLLAGTIVLRARSGAGYARAVRFVPPPGLAAFTASLDVTVLNHDDYGAVRSLLLRANGLPLDVRDQLARQIAGPLSTRLRITPPPALPAEQFLVCVAAAYQARFGAPQATSYTTDVWASAGRWSSGVGGAAAGVPTAGSTSGPGTRDDASFRPPG